MAMRRKGNHLRWGLHLKELAPRSWESHLCLVKLARETTLKNTCIPISQDYKEFTITCVLKKVPWRKIGEHSLSPFVSENFCFFICIYIIALIFAKDLHSVCLYYKALNSVRARIISISFVVAFPASSLISIPWERTIDCMIIKQYAYYFI